MNDRNLDFDAPVIGAGAGGMCAAARLSHLGYRTLLVEARERIGGRASTRLVDGFLCNTGALVIERDGAVAQTYKDLGLPLDLYVPEEAATVLRVGKRDINVTEGLIGWVRDVAPHVFAAISRGLPWFRPKKNEPLRSWLNRFTRSKSIHGLIDNVVGAMFAASADELPADVFVHYFTRDTAFKKIGMPPGGTIETWEPFAGVINAAGGTIWLHSTVSRLTFGLDGLVDGAVVERSDGATVNVSCRLAVSNAGPLATIRLGRAENFPAGYAEEIEEWSNPAAIITVHFASRTPLAEFPCLAIFSKTRRLAYAGNFSAIELNRAPRGWHLYCGASVPRPCRGEFDIEKEKALLLQDLHEQFPGFDERQIITIDVTAHDWPAQRAVTGFDQPQATPLANLWNVGDGRAGSGNLDIGHRWIFGLNAA